jgi:hypothetical protein
MIPSAEWVQSIFSCEFELNGRTFIAPNRDYPYEGLLVHQDGENWKFIDCIAINLQSQDGRSLSFFEETTLPTVRLSPWEVTYFYEAVLEPDAIKGLPPDRGWRRPGEPRPEATVPFSVSYRLHSAPLLGAVTGSIEVECFGAFSHPEVAWTIQPFVDLRHMFGHSEFDKYRVEFLGECDQYVRISSYNRVLTFYLPPGKVTRFHGPEVLQWRYKLGTGQRAEVVDAATNGKSTLFVGETKDVAALFHFSPQIPLESTAAIRLFFSCQVADRQSVFALPELARIDRESEQHDREQEQQIEQLPIPLDQPAYRDAVFARVVGLTNFKIFVRTSSDAPEAPIPPAGAWWFKTPWFRDVFEGILSSFQTLMSLPRERECIRSSILLALSAQNDATGLVPNRVPEFKDLPPVYNSSDATLLCLIAASAYLQEMKDSDLASKVMRVAMRMVAAAQRRADSPIVVDGPPRFDPETGLLLCAPHHSWMDTRTQCVEYAGYKLEQLPNRVSARFVMDLYDGVVDKSNVGALLSSPCFFLPEINAQWITALRGTLKTIPLATAEKPVNADEVEAFELEVSSILSRAEQTFRSVFWNEEAGFLLNLVYQDREIKDEVESEAGVTAAAILGGTIFGRVDLARIWARVKKKLLVKRRLVRFGNEARPFGILAKNEDRRIFYHDDQYHSDVIWLRSTPYLVRLLRFLGEEELVRQLVLNTLDHQVTEGAIFFNHELFSRPFGNNPCPDPVTRSNPVPVKNPIQFWSQWCDPMIDFPERKEPWQ